MTRWTKVSFYIFLVIACSFASFAPLGAQEGSPGATKSEVILGLFPEGGLDGDRFEVTLEPGSSAEMTAVMVSFGADPIRIRAYSSHIVPVPNGGMQIPDFGTAPEGTVDWLDFPTIEETTLQPDEPVLQKFVISVPDDAVPGQYVNAIALETLDPVSAEGSPFEQYFRKVVSVYVTVPGDIHADFELGTPTVIVSGGQSGIEFPLENTGNTRIDLTGTITLTDASGSAIFEGNVILGPVYNGQSTVWQVGLPGVPPAGDGYTISYTLTDRASSSVAVSNDVAVTIPEDATASRDAPISFGNISIEPNADPIVFANVSVDINLSQQAQRSTRLTLSVFHNGDFVEDFVMAENLTLPLGITTVSQRYLPAEDWEAGTYTFSLKLESTSSGQEGLLLEQVEVATIEVP